MVLPLSAFAESFTVTTNKNIYTPDEKAIIVGSISDGAPEGYAVLIAVSGPSGDCASMHVLPGSDNLFLTKAISLDECGFGEFTVSASYAEERATSTFIISNSSQADAGGKLELRTLKNVLLQAQESVNSRVKELIEADYVLPEEVARKYGEGVSEASLALQAMEFGDTVEAKTHMLLAIQDFRQVRDELSEENVARFEQTAEQKAASGSNSNVVGTYNILKKKYDRYQQLSDKNNVNNTDKFEAAALLLTNAKQLIDDRNYADAEPALEQVSAILEEILDSLYESNEASETAASNGEENDNSENSGKGSNSTSDQ